MKQEIEEIREKIKKLLDDVEKPSRESRHLNIALKELKFLLIYISDERVSL